MPLPHLKRLIILRYWFIIFVVTDYNLDFFWSLLQVALRSLTPQQLPPTTHHHNNPDYRWKQVRFSTFHHLLFFIKCQKPILEWQGTPLQQHTIFCSSFGNFTWDFCSCVLFFFPPLSFLTAFEWADSVRKHLCIPITVEQHLNLMKLWLCLPVLAASSVKSDQTTSTQAD